MRPPSIILFERVYILCILLSVASSILFFVHPPAFVLPPNTPPMVAQTMHVIPIVSLVVGLVISLLFLYFIGRRGSDVARWIFVALVVIAVAGVARQVTSSNGLVVIPLSIRIVSWIHIALEAACVWLIFRPDAKPWFRRSARGL